MFNLEEREYSHIYAKCAVDGRADGCNHEKRIHLSRVMLSHGVVSYLVSRS
jgi:ribosomal protein S14